MNDGEIPELGPTYTYRAALMRVIDGDTFILRVDLGFRAYRQEIIRLKGLDTPELRPRKKGRTHESLLKEKARARLAADFAHRALFNAKEIYIRTDKERMTFNRYVADVWYKEAGAWKNLATELMKAGHEK